MISFANKKAIVIFVLLLVYLASFTYLIIKANQGLDGHVIHQNSGVLTFVGSKQRVYKVILNQKGSSPNLKFYCNNNKNRYGLRDAGYCFPKSAISEMRNKNAVVNWYYRPTLISWPKKQITSIQTDGAEYAVPSQYKINTISDIILWYLLILSVVLLVCFNIKLPTKKK